MILPIKLWCIRHTANQFYFPLLHNPVKISCGDWAEIRDSWDFSIDFAFTQQRDGV